VHKTDGCLYTKEEFKNYYPKDGESVWNSLSNCAKYQHEAGGPVYCILYPESTVDMDPSEVFTSRKVLKILKPKAHKFYEVLKIIETEKMVEFVTGDQLENQGEVFDGSPFAFVHSSILLYTKEQKPILSIVLKKDR